MSDTFRTLIIPVATDTVARSLGAALSKSCSGMYLTALSASGLTPATHFISSGWIDDTWAVLMPLTTINPDGSKTTVVGPTALFLSTAQANATTQGITLTATLANVVALFAAFDLTSQPPFVAMARLGLQLVRVPL